MNSERLSRDDGITSGVVSTAGAQGRRARAGRADRARARWCAAGRSFRPGGWRSISTARATPRIECAAEHLFDHVPGVAHEDASGADVPAVCQEPEDRGQRSAGRRLSARLCHVSARTCRCESLLGRAGRACRAACCRRSSIGTKACSGGKLREAEIYERDRRPSRARSSPARPSSWLSSTARAWSTGCGSRPTQATAGNDDLWIEVTVDGESLPAIAAPARFLFPALPASESASSARMVLTRKEALPTCWPCPTATASRWRPAIGATSRSRTLAFSMSVDRATDKNRADYAGRMRLRGIFQPAGPPSSELVQQAGGGRWVALVYEQPDEARDRHRRRSRSTAQPRDGWAMADLDPFWGRPGEGENYFTALAGRQGNLGLALPAAGAGQLRAVAGGQAQRRRQARRAAGAVLSEEVSRTHLSVPSLPAAAA